MSLLSCKSPGDVLGSGRPMDSQILVEGGCVSGAGHCVFRSLGPACQCSDGRTLERLFCPGCPQHPQQVEFIFVSMPQGCPVLELFCLVPKSQGLRRQSDFYHTRGSKIQGLSLPCVPSTLGATTSLASHPRYLPERTLVPAPPPQKRLSDSLI